MSRERRLDRIEQVLSERLGHVMVAIQAVHHRHNVSAILRTCDALGIHRVDLVEGHFTPTRGASRGTERWLDLRYHSTPQAAVQAIHDGGYRLWVADLDEASRPPDGVPIQEPICLWFGAELEGVHPVAREAADGVVQIPMYGMAQSLNVSVAAAMTLAPVVGRVRGELGQAARLPEAIRARWQGHWRDRELAVDKTAEAIGGWTWPEPLDTPRPRRPEGDDS